MEKQKVNNFIDIAFCVHCKSRLYLTMEGNWVHEKGYGMHWQKCEKCGWEGSKHPSYKSCPDCGEWKRLLDDHHSLPTNPIAPQTW